MSEPSELEQCIDTLAMEYANRDADYIQKNLEKCVYEFGGRAEDAIKLLAAASQA